MATSRDAYASKNKDYPKNEGDSTNENDPINEDNPKMKTIQKMKITSRTTTSLNLKMIILVGKVILHIQPWFISI